MANDRNVHIRQNHVSGILVVASHSHQNVCRLLKVYSFKVFSKLQKKNHMYLNNSEKSIVTTNIDLIE